MADGSDFFGNSKNKAIETENFTIRGHLLRWADTAIQISNISTVSIEAPHVAEIPIELAMILSAVAVWFLSDGRFTIGSLVAFFVIAVLIAVAGAIPGIIAVATLGMNLKIRMNSGDTYLFSIKNGEFMRQVLQLLANIIEAGTTPNTNFHISVKDCEIRENGSVIHVTTESER